MTNNNWEEEFRSIGEGSVRFMATRQEVKQFISNLLTKKDQEHKEELEMIKGEIESKLEFDYSDNSLKNHRELGQKQAYRDALSILDKHINK